jgi:hypothetical protein
MARRCTCARLIAAVEGDPRLRTLPLAVRMLFLLVAEAAARSPVAGLLPFGETRRVSLLVSAPETDVETGLETLIAEGLLRRQDGGLGVPILLDVPPRAEVARRNGAAGGRPRKGETAEAARERRQGALLLPLAGKPSETQAGNLAPTTTDSSQSVSGGDARAPDWVSVGMQVAEIAGLDPARGGYDFRPVQAWLSQDYASRDDILAAVRRVASRPGYNAAKVRSLKYFDAAVEGERSARLYVHSSGGGAGLASVQDSAEDAARVAAAEARVAAIRARLAA